MLANQQTLRPQRYRPLTRRLLFVVMLTSVLMAFVACTAVSPEPVVTEPEPAAKSVTDDAGRTPPDRLQLPAIEADMPVVELGWHAVSANEDAIISEWDVAEYAAGWHKNSAVPGETGNIVMSGHNNIYGSVFRELDLLRKGDEAIVWTDGEPREYAVEQVLVVPEHTATQDQRIENAKWIGEFDEERLTLVSCWPRNNNTHRIIVVAYPASEAEQMAADSATGESATP